MIFCLVEIQFREKICLQNYFKILILNPLLNQEEDVYEKSIVYFTWFIIGKFHVC